MRILHLIYDHVNNPWVGGGGAVRVYEIYKRLADRHNITVVCGRYPGAKDYTEGNLKFVFLGTDRRNYVLSTIRYALAAALFVKRNSSKHDVVIEDFAPYNPVFSFLWNRRAILQLHQKEGAIHLKKYFLIGIIFILLENLYHKFFRNIIVESSYNKKKFSLKNDAAVIPNGFDKQLLLEEASDEGYILYLGRLHIHQKGLDVLCESLEYLSVDNNIFISGAGKDSAAVEKLFLPYMSSGKVKMTGAVSGGEKTDILKNCCFLILPSRYEGQPLVLLEAAACDKAVIVSDIPELRYAVEAGFGIAFKSGDARDLAKKIEFLLANDALREEMGRKAREYAKDFTWERIADECEGFLSSIYKVYNRY